MSPSAIFTITPVAAPSIGSANPAAAEQFEAMLTSEMAGGTIPAPFAASIRTVSADSTTNEPSAENGVAEDTAIEQPTDITVSSAWFQMTSVDLPPVASTALQGDLAGDGGTADASASPAPQTTVAGLEEGQQAPENVQPQNVVARPDAAALPGLAYSLATQTSADPIPATPPVQAAEGPTFNAAFQAAPQTAVGAFGNGQQAFETVHPRNAVARPDAAFVSAIAADPDIDTAAPTPRPADSKVDIKADPVKADPGIVSALNTYPAVPRSKPDAELDTPLVATAPLKAQPAEPAALGDAALTGLHQMLGAKAVQQAAISQRRTSALAVTLPASAGSANLPPTALSDTVESIVSAPLPSFVQAAGEPVGNAASALSPSIGGTTMAVDATLSSSPVKADIAVAAPAPSTNIAIDIATAVKPVDLPPLDVAAITDLPQEPSPQAIVNAASTAAFSGVAAQGDTLLSGLSRATIETTAHLAAQITSRIVGRSTRLELGLTPEGLGRVDVTLDIDADGQLSARLAFDNPLAATELRGRADELRRQLEDAGFTLARDALDFSSRDNPSGGDRRQQRATAYADRHAASNDPIDLAPAAWMPSSSRLTPQGVDVKV